MSEEAQPLTFEQGVRRLEEIVSILEGGTLTLDESIRSYEEAVRLAGNCDQLLRQAETRLQRLNSPESEPPRPTPE